MMQSAKDGLWYRLTFIATAPLVLLLGYFAAFVIACGFTLLIRPLRCVHTNSQHYSCKVDTLDLEKSLPIVTIEIPVYKEGFEDTLKPTMLDCIAALKAWSAVGGTGNILVNDDGLQLINEAERQQRIHFYDQHGIGYVARPPHSAQYARRGRFKKASNMNFFFAMQCRPDLATLALMGNQPRLGDLILLLDSDSRVPSDVLVKAVPDFVSCDKLGFVQFYTAPLDEQRGTYWLNGISYFTETIYDSLCVVCGGGDNSPMVGHNVILRTAAMQELANSEGLVWSESHVSEDFDMAMRLQNAGFHGRYATYCGIGFQEGVSLNFHDEITRFEKYAFGCSELVLNPFSEWRSKGVLAKTICEYMASSTPWYTKCNVLGYVCTYFSLGFALPATFINFAVAGWAPINIAKDMVNSVSIILSCLVVFAGMANVSVAVMKAKLGKMGFFRALFWNIYTLPWFFMFFGCMPYPILTAIFKHLLQLPISWGSTPKSSTKMSMFERFNQVWFMLRARWCMHLTFLVSSGILLVFSLPQIPVSNYHIKNFSFNAVAPVVVTCFTHLFGPSLMMLLT